MASIQASAIRRGHIIIYNNVPYRILDFQHRTPGNLRAFVQVKMRNMLNGSSTETRFSSTEQLEKAQLEEHEMQYLYSDAGQHHFMNTESYEQVALDNEILGDAVNYLIPNLMIKTEFLDGNPIGVELPSVVELKVIETEPGLKGATVSNVNKPAKLETGVVIQVPPFIQEGDVLRVNPNEGKYIERAK